MTTYQLNLDILIFKELNTFVDLLLSKFRKYTIDELA